MSSLNNSISNWLFSHRNKAKKKVCLNYHYSHCLLSILELELLRIVFLYSLYLFKEEEKTTTIYIECKYSIFALKKIELLTEEEDS
jgi:hypothetical protein